MPCFIKHTARSLWYYGNMVNIGRSILQLSKRIYRMWHDHPFSQRNKTTKRAVGVRGWRLEVEGSGEVGRRVGQNVKKRDRQYRGVFLKK